MKNWVRIHVYEDIDFQAAKTICFKQLLGTFTSTTNARIHALQVHAMNIHELYPRHDPWDLGIYADQLWWFQGVNVGMYSMECLAWVVLVFFYRRITDPLAGEARVQQPPLLEDETGLSLSQLEQTVSPTI